MTDYELFDVALGVAYELGEAITAGLGAWENRYIPVTTNDPGEPAGGAHSGRRRHLDFDTNSGSIEGGDGLV